jgi:predicted HicB family RNase H-like nuclease
MPDSYADKVFWQAEPAWKGLMSQSLQYKGFGGSVEYSAEDRVLHGSLLGIRDAVVYEGAEVDGLESNFRAVIDEYLAFCAEEGKIAERPVM